MADREGRVSRRARARQPRDDQIELERTRYGSALLLIVASIFVSALLFDQGLGGFLLGALQGVVLLIVIRSSGLPRRVVTAGQVLIGVALALLALTSVIGHETFAGKAIIAFVLVTLVASGPVLIGRRLVRDAAITFETVLGALCIYLLVGLLFAVVYASSGNLSGHDFFAQGSARSFDFVYFSFVTLTTVGYGDLTAAADWGRALALTEALVGQLYLVTVVAVTVTRLGQPTFRSRRRTAESSDAEDAGAS